MVSGPLNRIGKPVDIVCLGEPMVEFNLQPNGYWLQGFGGDVSNVSIAAARQDATSEIVTRLGNDSFGNALEALWSDEGVQYGAVKRHASAPTGLYFVTHDENGHVFEYRRAGSAASTISPSDLPLDRFENCSVLHVSGISQAISESSANAVEAATAVTKKFRGLVSFDPNLRLNLWPLERARAKIHETMLSADIALPGLDDARKLTGLTAPEDIVRFYLQLGPSIVALTLGEDGAMIATSQDIQYIPAHKAQAVDATGAGDCFDGAFLAEWLRTGDPGEAGRYAVAAASLSTEGYGAIAPIPLRKNVHRQQGV